MSKREEFTRPIMGRDAKRRGLSRLERFRQRCSRTHVAQNSILPYRRSPDLRTVRCVFDRLKVVLRGYGDWRAACRTEFGDTAERSSALRQSPDFDYTNIQTAVARVVAFQM